MILTTYQKDQALSAQLSSCVPEIGIPHTQGTISTPEVIPTCESVVQKSRSVHTLRVESTQNLHPGRQGPLGLCHAGTSERLPGSGGHHKREAVLLGGRKEARVLLEGLLALPLSGLAPAASQTRTPDSGDRTWSHRFMQVRPTLLPTRVLPKSSLDEKMPEHLANKSQQRLLPCFAMLSSASPFPYRGRPKWESLPTRKYTFVPGFLRSARKRVCTRLPPRKKVLV